MGKKTNLKPKAESLKVKRAEAENAEVKSQEAAEPRSKTENPKAKNLAIIEEKKTPRLEKKTREKKKALLIIYWQILSLFFMHFRRYLSFLICLVLVFSSFSLFWSSLVVTNII